MLLEDGISSGNPATPSMTSLGSAASIIALSLGALVTITQAANFRGDVVTGSARHSGSI
jgi:hypothetical protein